MQTVIFPTDDRVKSMSSTLIKSIVSGYGLVHEYVHPKVKQKLEQKLLGLNLVAITGNMGSGKSSVAKDLVEYCKKENIEAYHLDLDKIIQSMYSKQSQYYSKVRKDIESEFGDVFEAKDGELNRKKLSAVVFGDEKKRKKLAEILTLPTIASIESFIKGKKGLVFVDAAYFVEYNLMPITNYNTILVKCDEKERLARIMKRDKMTEAELNARVKSQIPCEQLKERIKQSQEKQGNGFYYEYDNTDKIIDDKLKSLVDQLTKYFAEVKN
jgi:dephospho-CoA kinase